MRLNGQFAIFPKVNALSLLKSLAPGFIPLFGYIAADLIFGETIGLFIGIGIGVLEFAFSFAKEKKADLFIAADTVLLSALGALSLLLRNQIFFRLKPAIMEGIVAFAMAALLILPTDVLKSYMGHQVKGLVLEDSGMPALRRSLAIMTVVFVLHVGITVWAALFASTALWGFVSGGLLYILLGAVVLTQWIAARKARKTGKSATPGLRSPSFGWCLFVFDGSGKIYAAKTSRQGEDQIVWDSPVRGIALKASDMETMIGKSLAGLGMDFASIAAAGNALTIQVAFILSADGTARSLSGAGDLSSLSAVLESGEEGLEVVLAVTIPPLAFPKGIDPTERRFWRLADLAALMGTGKLARAFERELGFLLSPRMPLRDGAAASIVSTTNDAVV